MIAVEHVAKKFVDANRGQKREVLAVNDVTFTARDGVIMGLLGPNGAGKTTTMRMIAGLIEPDTGSVHIDGVDAVNNPTAALAKVGVLSDAHGLYPRLTAKENIMYFAQLQGLSRQAAAQRADQLATTLGMTEFLNRRALGFSQGERMKTALARALVHDPKNLILDEPTNGLDVLATRSLRETLRKLRDEQGKCIIVSTHIMQEVERLCDHVVVIAHGRIRAEGTVSELNTIAGHPDFEETFVSLAFGAQP